MSCDQCAMWEREYRRGGNLYEMLQDDYIKLFDTVERLRKVEEAARALREESSDDDVAAYRADVLDQCLDEYKKGSAPPTRANRYHQRLGAKWMCEAIVKRLANTFSTIPYSKDLQEVFGRMWEDEESWRPASRGDE